MSGKESKSFFLKVKKYSIDYYRVVEVRGLEYENDQPLSGGDIEILKESKNITLEIV